MRAPVAIFAYNRKEHLERTINALLLNSLADQTDCYIFCDGAKKFATDAQKTAQEQESITAVRDYIKTIEGFKSVTIEYSDKNKGLANSIIYGVTKIIEAHKRIIVLEDDLITSPFFLEYMNQGLDLYKEDSGVGVISAYMYPVRRKLGQTFFSTQLGCWGWGTWADRWAHFNPNGQQLLDALEKSGRVEEFNLQGTYHYVEILKDQIAGRNNSWAIRWYASIFLNNMLCLYPGISFVENIGFDESGTNCQKTDYYAIKSFGKFQKPLAKIPVQPDTKGMKTIHTFFKKKSFKDFFKDFPFDIAKAVLPKPVIEFLRKKRRKSKG